LNAVFAISPPGAPDWAFSFWDGMIMKLKDFLVQEEGYDLRLVGRCSASEHSLAAALPSAS
jgi:hypothetical protein